MQILRTVFAAAALALSLACEKAEVVPAAIEDVPVASGLELRDGMRLVWTEHVYWEHAYIISALADLPDKNETLARLMRNQTDIGEAMKPYYGNGFGDELTELLEEHIRIAGELIDAARSGDTPRVTSLSADWRVQADEIALFLSNANPAFELQAMLQRHLDLSTADLMARLNQDWVGGVAAFDALQNHAVQMADAFAEGTAAQYPRKVTETAASAREQALHLALRELWHEHVAWTRLYIVSDVAELPDVQATTARLLKNQSDLGDAIKPIYGTAAGDELTRLLREHITGAVLVLTAAKSGDQAALQAASASWIANADQLATFLTTANPFLDPAHVRSDLRTHLDQLTTEASHRLTGAYEAEIVTYDDAVAHILHFSDELAAAIGQQSAALTGSQ